MNFISESILTGFKAGAALVIASTQLELPSFRSNRYTVQVYRSSGQCEISILSVMSGSIPQIVDLFLCHNGADKEWVRQLGEQIESETIDGTSIGRKLRVFLDEWDIDEGTNVIVQINQGLARARFVAVVISPEMLRAPWPTMEWTHIVSQDPINKQGRLIPLFLRAYSDALNERAELPAPFRALKWIDFRKAREFNRSYQRLIRKIRGLPPERGRSRRPLASLSSLPISTPESEQCAAPDAVADIILSNLLPVESYPQTVWSAPTHARKNQDVWNVISKAPAFELQETRLAFSRQVATILKELPDGVEPLEKYRYYM